MNAAFPSHGSHCGMKTYQTTCRYCGHQVFHLSCSHKSSFFVDALGAPWPPHECLERVIHLTGKEAVQRAIGQQMMSPGYSRRAHAVERRHCASRKQQSRSARKPETIIREPASDATVDAVGQISDFAHDYDLGKLLPGDSSSPIHRALVKTLGILAQGPVTRVVLMVDDKLHRQNIQYNALVPTRLFREQQLDRKHTLRFKLSCLAIAGVRQEWEVIQLEKI